MRYAITAMLMIVGLAWHSDGVAQDSTEIGYTTWHRGQLQQLFQGRAFCPFNRVPLHPPVIPNPDPANLAISAAAIDRQGGPLSVFNRLNDLAGAGYAIKFTTTGPTDLHGAYFLSCRKADGLTGAAFQRTIQPGPTNFFALACPSSQVPVGYVSDADGTNLEERSRLHLLNQAQTPLNALADGTYTVSTMALGVGVRNNTAAPIVLNGLTFCAALTNAQFHVTSTPILTGAPFEAFAPIPDGFDFANNAFTVSGAVRTHVAYWTAREGFSNWLVARGSRTLNTFSITDATPEGVYLYGDGTASSNAKQQPVGRAVIGTLLVPLATPVPPPTIVSIVEFYNASLDHYFITASAKEIADLDSGVHVGWQRTNESFRAYDVGSSGRTGRRPVCRAYGNPAAGLDSHFYSASPQECVATLLNFGDDWLPEAAEVFQMELPDATSGACASDRVPVYRLWNGRTDSSHRFVKSLALRTQMIARGFVSEGYGPNGVVFCALP